jgi:hypothetical protein
MRRSALSRAMTADRLSEPLLDVANQRNRAAGRLTDRDEKAQRSHSRRLCVRKSDIAAMA